VRGRRATVRLQAMLHARPGGGALSTRTVVTCSTPSHLCCLCLCLSAYARPISLRLQQHQLLLCCIDLGTSLEPDRQRQPTPVDRTEYMLPCRGNLTCMMNPLL
jgi:hypothetical protein